MGSKVVIVKLEEVGAGAEYSALLVTWAPDTKQGKDCGFQFIDDRNGDRLACETQEELEGLASVKKGPVNEWITINAWEEYANSFGDTCETQLEVTTYHSSSSDGSFIVRRVSFLDGGVWVEPKTHFVVLPCFGARVIGVFSDPARAVAVAETSAQGRKELAGAARDRTTGYKGS